MSDRSIVVNIVRHGKVHNPENVFYGRLEGFHIAEEGRNMAKELGKKLVECGIAQQLSKVYSSPQLRARETAECIIEGIICENSSSISFTKNDIDIAESFNEILSPLQGISITKLNDINWRIYDPCNIKKLLETDEIPPFETFEQGYSRTIDGIKNLAVESINNGYNSILITTHGCSCLAAKMWVNGIDASKRDEVLEDKEYYPLYCGLLSITLDKQGNIINFSEISGNEVDDGKKI